MKTRMVALLLESHLAAGGDAVVVGGERLAPARLPVCIDEGAWLIQEVPRFAAPGIRCTLNGRTWFIATATRQNAQEILDRAVRELDASAA